MSEFFKALEQAERDRQLAERIEPVAPGSVAGAERVDAPEGSEDVTGGSDKTPAAPRAVAAAGAAAAAPSSPPAAPASPPVEARPTEGRRRSVFDRLAPAPRPPGASPRPQVPPDVPSPVERPVPWVAERVAPAAPERAAPAERVMAPPPERPAPVPAEPDAALAPPSPIQRSTARPDKWSKAPVLIADLDPRSVAAEAYRTLRANLEFMPNERGCRTIVITSPSMGEGKSTTAANLAVVAAQAGSRVCLVDADMRRPTMHTIFDVPNQGGFTKALSQAIPLASVAIATGVPNLSLVVAGSADGLRPAQLLNVARLQKVIQDPLVPFDLVLIDTPPVISVADAMNLAPHSDGVLLVVRAGAVPPSVLQHAVRQINQVKGKVLGVLLNQVDLSRGEAEFYRYYRAYYTRAQKD